MAETENYVVTIVKYGTLETIKSDVFLNYSIYGEPDAPIEMGYFFWIVHNPQRTIVVDTGFSRRGGQRRHRTSLIDVAVALNMLGIAPASNPDVVLTHAHYDHIGNLDLFSESRILVSNNEYQFWTGGQSARAQFRHSVETAEIAGLQRAFAQGRVSTFDNAFSLAPGIEIIRVGGHTPGQSIVKVSTTDGTVLLASDAIHFYEEYEHDRPFTYVADLVAMYDAFDRIRAMLEAEATAHLVTGHDASTLERFRPVEGELAGLAATIGGSDD